MGCSSFCLSIPENFVDLNGANLGSTDDGGLNEKDFHTSSEGLCDETIGCIL